jgi:signal transduction histidine kinase
MKRKKITPYSLLLPVCILLAFNCNRINNTNGHSQYLDKVFDSAKRLSDSGSPARAFAYLDSSYRVYKYIDKYDLVRKYHVKSFYYINISHDYEKALPIIDSMLMILENNPEKNRNEYAYALVEKGHIQLEQNLFNEAFNSYYTAKVFLQKYSDTCGQAQISNNLGLILYKQQKYSGAKDYFQKAFEEASFCSAGGNSSTLADMQGFLDNIALCYDHLGMYDSAVLYYTKALNFIAQNEKKFPPYSDTYISMARAVIFGNLGGVYSKMGKADKAEPLLKESIRINDQPGYYNDDAQYTRIKLANLYLATGRREEALAVIQQIRTLLNKQPIDEAELRWRKLAWIYYDSVGNPGEAYKYYKSYINFKDSFDLKRKDLPGADFNKTFTNLSQLYQIDLLKKSNQVKNAYLILVLVLIIMAMGIIFLVRRNYRQSKRNVVRLVSLNKQISEHNMHMQKTLNALEQSQEENTRMLKVITHDLRNPITSIVAIADMLLSNGGFGDDINQLLDIMRRSGLTATRMAEEILRAHSTEMPMEKVELQELLSFTVNMMQFKAKEKKQNIILTTEPVSIKANNDKLWRVMNNLIGNAIKFSPPGTCIRVNLAKKDVSALISIKDEGLGIAPELKEKVFDPFTPYKRPGTMGEESFGLGLSISKYIIEAHGGRLWFESELGKGSTFYIELIAKPAMDKVEEL